MLEDSPPAKEISYKSKQDFLVLQKKLEQFKAANEERLSLGSLASTSGQDPPEKPNEEKKR